MNYYLRRIAPRCIQNCMRVVLFVARCSKFTINNYFYYSKLTLLKCYKTIFKVYEKKCLYIAYLAHFIALLYKYVNEKFTRWFRYYTLQFQSKPLYL